MAMSRRDKKRSDYYQSIARYFFKQRGAPFFLSSSELDIVAKWEEIEIPLSVALEGIRRAFENYRGKPGKKSKIQTIAYCEPQVLMAYEQYRERRVGGDRKPAKREEKRALARAEVKRLLDTLPEKLGYLRETYSLARRLLSRRQVEEEKLERIDGEVENLIWEHSSQEERDAVKKTVRQAYKVEKEEELSRIIKIKLVKDLRDQCKIPYVSLFYY